MAKILESQLFMGMIPQGKFKKALLNPPYFLSVLSGGGDYLTRIHYKNTLYLGKFVPPLLSLERLELLETHISSFLKPFVPKYLPYIPELLLIPLFSDGDFSRK